MNQDQQQAASSTSDAQPRSYTYDTGGADVSLQHFDDFAAQYFVDRAVWPIIRVHPRDWLRVIDVAMIDRAFMNRGTTAKGEPYVEYHGYAIVADRTVPQGELHIKERI